MEKNGCRVIIIGDKKHDEVRGIVGQLKKKALVIDKPWNIPLGRVKKIRKAGIVVQSTQSMDNVKEILEILRKFIPEVSFRNTICNPTRVKQEEIRSLPRENSVVIIIGSRTSANTKRLYEISRSINPRSWRVNSAEEIKKSWLKGAASGGVTAGASTPESSIKEVIKELESMRRA
jgi:4-hydroxy-3-methylbut-2-enyl diphosphate reductase